jgi:hypothetical protein
LTGRIAFPGRAPPAATIYVRALDGLSLHRQALRRGETQFSIEVPAGRYWVFARPDEPGLSGLYGAHTQFSLCSRGAGAETSGCTDHAPATVEVPADASVLQVDVDDWMLGEETAAELDGVLGAAPVPDGTELGRPRFSEYRVPRNAGPQSVALDLATEPRAAPYALLRVACGAQCVRVAIIDLQTGAIALPEQLSQGLGSLPCRTERDLDFREDSRLLEFTRREAESVVTDYLLWDTEQRRLAPLAQYRRSLERFCNSADK